MVEARVQRRRRDEIGTKRGGREGGRGGEVRACKPSKASTVVSCTVQRERERKRKSDKEEARRPDMADVCTDVLVDLLRL